MNDDLKTPYELFGIECGKGWHPILVPLFEYIEKYNIDKKNDEKIIIKQVKEKFGGLRFYCNFETDELNKLIRQAEAECNVTCELCGTKENVGKTLGWITTCCEDCVRKMSERRNHVIYRWKPLNCDENIKWYEFGQDKDKEPNYKLEN